MGIRHLLFITILSAFLVTSCKEDGRKQELDAREQAISKREMEFAAKAADYQSLLQMRDSLLSGKSDTAIVQRWPAGIAGDWNGKLLCRESDCPDYVVGDQRNDTWSFAQDSVSIFTKIINKDKLLRIYTATVDSTEIRLRYATDSAASRKVEINVVLAASGDNLLKGTQTVSVNNNCTARFSVELVRRQNP